MFRRCNLVVGNLFDVVGLGEVGWCGVVLFCRVP